MKAVAVEAVPAGQVTGIRPPGRRSSAWRKLAIVLALLILWELAVRLSDADPLLYPPASTVLPAFARSLASGQLPGYAWQSLKLLLTGMAIGSLLALAFTTLATLTRVGRDLLETLTSMFNPLPAIALVPLAILWFGLGTASLVFVLVHAVLWPLSLNTYSGFMTVPRTLVLVGRNLGLRNWAFVQGILLPAAFPHILTGLKIGWAFAWRTIIAAEMVFGVSGSRGGLGWYIYTKRYDLDTPAVFAGLFTVILIGLAVEHLVFEAVEQRTVRRWGMSD